MSTDSSPASNASTVESDALLIAGRHFNCRLFTGTGKWGRDEGIGFSREEYPEGFTLYAWDLTPDLSDPGDHFQLLKNTTIRLELVFGQPLALPTTVVVFAKFQNMIMIDRDRNVTTNYTS